MSKYNFTKIRKDRNVDEIVANEVVATNTAFNNPIPEFSSGVNNGISKWMSFGINSGITMIQLYIDLTGYSSLNNAYSTIGITSSGGCSFGNIYNSFNTLLFGKIECNLDLKIIGAAIPPYITVSFYTSVIPTIPKGIPLVAIPAPFPTPEPIGIENRGTAGWITDITAPSNPDNKYLYMVTRDGIEGDYEQGKFIMTLWGTN